MRSFNHFPMISVVRQMNQHYHMCVASSRQLQQRLGSSVQTALSPQIVIATADKLIYNYAIEMVNKDFIMWAFFV